MTARLCGRDFNERMAAEALINHDRREDPGVDLFDFFYKGDRAEET